MGRVVVPGLPVPFQIVAGGRSQTELVAHEEFEYCAGVAANRAVRLVGDHQIEVRGREEPLVLVVEQQGLDGGDDDLGTPPVIAVLFVDDRVKVRRQQRVKDLVSLVFQFQPVHQKKDATRIAGAKEQLDDRGGGERLAGSGGHLEQKTVASVFHRPLQGVDRLELVGAQEAQLVGLDEAGSLGLVPPGRLRGVAGPLGQHDVVVADPFLDQALRVGFDLSVAGYRVRRRERGDDVGIATFQVPEVMQIAV